MIKSKLSLVEEVEEGDDSKEPAPIPKSELEDKPKVERRKSLKNWLSSKIRPSQSRGLLLDPRKPGKKKTSKLSRGMDDSQVLSDPAFDVCSIAPFRLRMSLKNFIASALQHLEKASLRVLLAITMGVGKNCVQLIATIQNERSCYNCAKELASLNLSSNCSQVRKYLRIFWCVRKLKLPFS